MQTEGAMILITDKWSLLQGMYIKNHSRPRFKNVAANS